MKNDRELSSNMEDYLEAIAILKKENGVARVKDISRLLDVRPSSVTAALNSLSEKGYVSHEPYAYVDLTSQGTRVAQSVLKRHNILFRFLTEILGIDPRIAQRDACKMEHSMSPKTLEKLMKFVDFVDASPHRGKPDWLKRFDDYSRTGMRRRYTEGDTSE
jgi:DtxR family Mn-dependent transcriptional regulator